MNISCRIANADTQCGRITNPPEREDNMDIGGNYNFYSNHFVVLYTLYLDEGHGCV